VNKFDELASISPFPAVNLKEISLPCSGFHIGLNRACLKNYQKNEKCLEHYKKLASSVVNMNKLIQCPYGFSSISFKCGELQMAFTGLIPHPRIGGDEERNLAKIHPETKMPIDNIHKGINGLLEIDKMFNSIESETLKNYSMALHEIRKLNRTVKQTAERLCMKENPERPTASNPELVQIWKSADLMSTQFDVIEILANESLAELPMNNRIDVYRIFDKCVKIYQPSNTIRRIRIYSPTGYQPIIMASDKTFSIIPTVLIENALKYSKDDSGISISISKDIGKCMVKVSNTANMSTEMNDNIFKRGRRLSSDKEGSGNGLYVAQLVARQHGTRIYLENSPVDDFKMKCTFCVAFNTIN